MSMLPTGYCERHQERWDGECFPCRMDASREASDLTLVHPRLRLGRLLQQRRAQANLSIERIAEVIGITPSMLTQAEQGTVPLNANRCRQFSQLTRTDYESLLKATRDHLQWVWEERRAKAVLGAEITGDARIATAVSPTQVFFEYREGWIAGASGRPAPEDMSTNPGWMRGHSDGSAALETALQSARLDLGLEG